MRVVTSVRFSTTLSQCIKSRDTALHVLVNAVATTEIFIHVTYSCYMYNVRFKMMVSFYVCLVESVGGGGELTTYSTCVTVQRSHNIDL